MLSNSSLHVLPSLSRVNVLHWCYFTQPGSSLCSYTTASTLHRVCKPCSQTHLPSIPWDTQCPSSCSYNNLMYALSQQVSLRSFLGKIWLCVLMPASFSSKKFLILSLWQLCTLSCPFCYVQYTSLLPMVVVSHIMPKFIQWMSAKSLSFMSTSSVKKGEKRMLQLCLSWAFWLFPLK